MLRAEIRKKNPIFIWKFSFFLVAKFSIYLNRLIFVKYALWFKGLTAEAYLSCGLTKELYVGSLTLGIIIIFQNIYSNEIELLEYSQVQILCILDR